ncbi:MAG: hypothetical protein FXF54_07465 [Kosmotoga sp.]|nr:MAG: hypothetical protein FXF54_07465 [Kosmotoga sp.]
MKKYLILALVLIFGVALFGEFSVGLNSLFFTNYSLGVPGTPTAGGVIGIDPRISFGPVYAGLSTPFMFFGASLGEGTGIIPFPPGLIWHAYIGGKFDIGNFYVMGDIGAVLVILLGNVPGMAPIRIGGGWYFSEHGFLELNTLAFLQDFFGSVGRFYYLELGYEF